MDRAGSLSATMGAIRTATEGLARRFLRATSVIAPLDVRCLLALVCLPLAYKLLSLDFTALGDLCARPPIAAYRPAWLFEIFNANRCLFFVGDRTRGLALVAAALLVLTVAKPGRLLLAPAIVATWILDTGAAQYRGNIYTTDTPLALLVLLFVTPVRLSRAAAWSPVPSRDAQIAMLMCLFFVATYYVQAGIAKLQFDWRWMWVVKVGNYYPISWIWSGQTMPDAIEVIARGSSEFLRAYPWADTAGGGVVLVEQFVWLLAPFSVLMRIHAGLFAAAYHVAVVVMTGIVFITWIPIALAVTLPFSSVVRWRTGLRTESADDRPFFWSGRVALVALIASVAAWLPTFGVLVPPFHNYKQFGWRYPDVAEVPSFYRVGFRNPQTQAIDVVPLGHGAFLDFRHGAGLDTWSRGLIDNRGNVAAVNAYRTHLESILIATRPPEANGWLFGRGRSPDHLLGKPGDVRIVDVKDFLLLKGTPIAGIDGLPARARFAICGTVRFDRAQAKTELELYETCREP